MIFRRFNEEGLAQASYLIGCPASGEALVVDANRDAAPYLGAADSEGLRITHITETHIHADFVSGSRELAHCTGARLYLSAEGGKHWQYGFAAESGAVLLSNGYRFRIGSVEVEAVHTPGHTPEHMSFVVTDTAVSDRPLGAITGDLLFVGDVGRPDLLERAVKMAGTMEAGAHQLYRSLQRFKEYPDYLQLWPAHGAGSACGKSLGGVPQSTLGYEKIVNWAFNTPDEASFVREVLSGQPDPPPYFARMKQANKDGPPLLADRRPPVWLRAEELPRILEASELVIDTRPADAFAAGYVPGTINVQAIRTFITWAGWLCPYDRPFTVIAQDEAVQAAVDRSLLLIGLERNVRYMSGDSVSDWRDSGRPIATIPRLDAPAAACGLSSSKRPFLLDVRQSAEWSTSRIADSVNIPLGHLESRVDEIPRDEPILIICRVGNRSVTAASILKARGFDAVSDVRGGIAAWKNSDLPVEG